MCISGHYSSTFPDTLAYKIHPGTAKRRCSVDSSGYDFATVPELFLFHVHIFETSRRWEQMTKEWKRHQTKANYFARDMGEWGLKV